MVPNFRLPPFSKWIFPSERNQPTYTAYRQIRQKLKTFLMPSVSDYPLLPPMIIQFCYPWKYTPYSVFSPDNASSLFCTSFIMGQKPRAFGCTPDPFYSQVQVVPAISWKEKVMGMFGKWVSVLWHYLYHIAWVSSISAGSCKGSGSGNSSCIRISSGQAGCEVMEMNV